MNWNDGSFNVQDLHVYAQQILTWLEAGHFTKLTHYIAQGEQKNHVGLSLPIADCCGMLSLRSPLDKLVYILGRGDTWAKFYWVGATGTSEPYPIIVYFWSILWPNIDPILATFGYYSMVRVYFVASYKNHLNHFWANDFLTLKVLWPILVTLFYIYSIYKYWNAWKDDPIIVSRLVKIRPHLAAHPQ